MFSSSFAARARSTRSRRTLNSFCMKKLSLACVLAWASLSVSIAPTPTQAQQRAATPSAPSAAAAAPAPRPTKAQLAAELANALQACSYDGSPVRFTPPDLSQGGDAGKKVVAEIMKYTGLPQNFAVVEGKVPNAAAVIMLDSQRIPRRVIAYNKDFMAEVTRATQNNNWAPISIMAHEIGHHLSGHTMIPGGSQPPIELEADKFSGFVLFKMGASLPDAVKALQTLVPEQEGQTHPGRKRRVAAVQQGWQEACSHQSDKCDGGVHPQAAAPMTKPAPANLASATSAPTTTPAPAPAPSPTVAASPAPTPAPASASAGAANTASPTPSGGGASPTPRADQAQRAAAANVALKDAAARLGTNTQTTPNTGPIASLGKPDAIPVPSKDAIPNKFDRFVLDETGLFDAGEKAKLSKAMYDFAKEREVEVVTLIVDNLHGLSADEYAHTMMRQLRVGKMDVGNGAVLVAAPKLGHVGVALGSGLFYEIDQETIDRQIKRPITSFVQDGMKSRRGDGPVSATWSSRVSDAADYIRRGSKNWEWTIRYPEFESFKTAQTEENTALDAGQKYEPKKSPTFRKLVRVRGVVNSLNGPKDYKENERFRKLLTERAPKGGYTVEIKTPEGDVVIAYVDAYTQRMMTHALAEGRMFSFVLRTDDARKNIFNMMSYAQAI
jgi:hypothetical protein